MSTLPIADYAMLSDCHSAAGLRPERTGALFLADLGIPAGVYRRLGLQFRNPFTDRFTLPLRCLGHPE